MKKIEDYLHLYIGCDCMIGDLKWKREQFTHGLAPGVDLDYGKPIKSKLDAHVLNSFANKTTLILRPLASLTEVEIEKYLRLKHNAYSGEYEIKICDNGFWWLFKGLLDTKFKFFGEVVDESNADQFRYLLSRGFDLFGLCDEGLALSQDMKSKNETV